MILEESLWPGMTRHGFAHRTYVRIAPADRDTFPVTSDGLWLPGIRVSEESFNAATGLIDRLDQKVERFQDTLASIAMKHVHFDPQTGCWPLSIDDDAAHTEMLWQLAEIDMRGPLLNQKLSKAALQVCETERCLNARHFDVTHAVKNRDRLLEVDPTLYDEQQDGTLLPVWEKGESDAFYLPSVKDSAQALRALQERCVPFIADPLQAPLTPGAISKITLEPTTGCWVTRTYYNRPDAFEKSFMYDGYGRLGFGPDLRAKGVGKVGRFMAHRVTWAATGNALQPGRVLNHECGFHPCCNPGHLRQMTTRDNNKHGRRMNDAMRSSQAVTTAR